MAFDLKKITKRALSAVFNLGSALVKDASYYRAPSFNPATGEMISAEVVASCQFVGGAVLSANYLGFATVVPGTETLVVRANQVSAISSPGQGDYIVEDSTGLRRNVEAGRLDPSGEFFIFQCLRTMDEDWGDLAAHTPSEDWGDLTAATAFDDRMALT